jgi:phosphonate transport system permease protein
VFGRRGLKWAVYAGVFGFLVWSAWGLRVSPTRFVEGLGYGRVLLGQMLPPSADSAGIARIVDKLGESIAMAMVATVTGIVLSVPVAFMAAENISPRPLYYANRGLISLSRALHGLIVAIIAVKAVGIGPLAGIVAITFKTIGFF